MTSTNDGKDVKCNQISGQKGKTHYIELYKSLDSRLSGECGLRDRTAAVCAAWRAVHRLCLHSAHNTTTHLLSWLQRHTANTILQTEWQSPSSKDEHARLEQAIDAFTAECLEARGARASPTWESQLLQRGAWFKRVLSNPWGHPVLKTLLDPLGRPTDQQIVEWLKEERGVMFVTRLRVMAAGHCDDLAVLLAAAVMSRVRRDLPTDHDMADHREKPHPKPETDGPSFREILMSEAGFTVDVWELLTDIEFVLLHKAGKSAQCIDLAKRTPLRNGYQLVERLQSRLETSPREKKLWKNARDVAILIAQVVIARCMVVPTCAGVCRSALYCCARSLVRLLPPRRLPPAAASLAAPACTARHLHTLAAAVYAECTSEMKPFVCELYIRAITAGMNELERLRVKTETEADARAAEQTLALWFVALGEVLAGSDRVRAECALTAFSLHPAPAMYDLIHNAPALKPVSAQEKHEPKLDESATSEFGSWASDSCTKTNLVKTSETLNIKKTEKHSNVLSTAILTEGEALGLSPELCQDLAVLLSGPRLKTLTWDLDRDALLAKCVGHMERTHGGTRALTTELRFLNLDPSHYQHLPEDDEDENDIYYGIEKGYEHHVDFQEDPVFDNERTETAASSDAESDDAVVARRKKKATRLVESEDDEALSHIAEQNRIEKKERQNRDRSKEKDKTWQERDKTKQKKDKRERKKEKKKERKKKKAQPKEMNNLPLGSLSSLIGMKVSVPNERKIETVTVPSAPSVSDGENDSQGKVNSERIETEVVFDGVYSMDEIKSPERVLPATKPNVTKVTPSRPFFGPKKAVPSHLSPVNEQVKRSINKLLSIRRQQYTLDPRAAAKTSANKIGPPPKSNAIKNPDVVLTGQVSPKVVNIPEIPKTYISKNQVESINARRLSAVRKEPTKPIVQNPKVSSTMPVNVPTVLNNELSKNVTGSLQHRGYSNNILPKSSNTSSESRKTHPITLSESRKTRPIVPSESRKTYPVAPSENRNTHPITMTENINNHPSNMTERRKSHSHVVTENRTTCPNSMTERRKIQPNAMSESRITYPNTMTDSRKAHSNAMSESRVTYPSTMTESRKILSNAVPESLTSCPNIMSESLKTQSNAMLDSRNTHPNSIVESRSNQPNPVPNNPNIYTQNYNIPPTPATDLSQQSFHDFLKELQKTINAGAGVDKTVNVIQNRPYAGHMETGLANRMSAIIPPSDVKVPNIQDSNPAPQCAKQITQKKDTLNTFSRLSYLHKSKITEKTKQAIMYDPREQETLNSEITEHINAKMKYYQSKNDVALSRVIHSGPKPEACQPLNHHVKKTEKQNSVVAMEHPILSDILQSQLQDAHDFVMSNTQQQRVTEPNNTLLTEQENMLLLVRQQNNINTKHSDVKITSAKVPFITQCSTTNLQPTIKCNYIQSSTVTPTHVTHFNQKLSSNALELLRPHVNVQKVSGNNRDINTTEKIQTVTKPVQSVAKASLQHKISEPKRDMNKSVEKPASKGGKKLDWESVMNAIRAQKTPSRGPNALDLALKKDSVERAYTESVLRKHRIGRTHSSGDASVKNKSALMKHNETATKPKSNVSESQQTPKTPQGLDKAKTNNHKHEKSKAINHTLGNDNPKVVVLRQEPIESSNQTNLHKKHAKKSSSLQKKQFTCLQKEEDPFISGIQNSDYDLLEELMDDDLRQEIGELSSDDESFLEARFQNHKLYKNNVTIKTIPALNKDSIPQIQDNINVVDTYIQPGPHGMTKKTAVPLNFAKNNKQHPLVGTSIITGTKVMLPKSQIKPDTALTNSATRPPTVIQHLPANIMLTPKSDTKQFITPSCNIALNQPNKQPPNIFVAPVAHQKSLQKVVIIGSELVYDPYTVQAPIHAAATAPAQSAQAAYVTINSPNVTMYQTAKYDAPIVNPLIIGNADIPTDTEPATPVVVSNPSQNNVDSIINPLDIPSLPKTISADNQLNEIVTENTPKFKTVPVEEVTVPKDDKITRDVNSNEKSESNELPPVQERRKVKKPRKQTSKRRITKDTKVLERVNMKRLAIMNREINHRCSNSPIPLTYAPLHCTASPDIENKLPGMTDTKQIDTEETKCDDVSIIKNISIVDFETNEISSPASHSSENSQENDDETVQRRRILLRSSNKIRAKVSTSNSVAENQVVKKTKVRLKRLNEDRDDNNQQEHQRSEIETQEVLENNGNKAKEPQIVSKKVKKGLPKQKRKQKNNKKSRRDKLQKQQNEETNGEVLTSFGLKVNVEDALLGSKIPKIVISKKECINNNDSVVNSTKPELTEYQSKLVHSSAPTDLPGILENPTDPKITDENEVNNSVTNSLPTSEILTNVSHPTPEMFVDELAELTLCTKSVIANMTVDNVTDSEAAAANIEVANCLQNLEENDLSMTPMAATVPNTDKIPEASNIVSETEMIVGAHHINIDTTQVLDDDDDDVIILTQEENIPSNNTSMEINFGRTNDFRQLDMDTNAIDKHSVPQSFRDGIIIEHLPNVTGDYTRKCVRIKLPSGRVFKATVHGLLPVNFDTLFADPSIKATLLSSLTDQKKYTMNIKQVTTADKEDPGKILATQFQEINILPRVISGEIETVDLLSDDDSDLDDLNQNLSTEYGKFKVAKMDREILKRHQTKMNQNCIVKLARETLKGNKNIKETAINEIESNIASNTRISQPTIANFYEIERVINNINNLIDSSSQSASVTNCNEVINTRKPIENINATIPPKNTSNVTRSQLKSTIVPVQEIIELDDSSNDSVDLVPRSQDPKNTTSIPSVNAQPKDVIIELKGQLLKDLGVETLGDGESSDNDVIFVSDDKAVQPETAPKPNKNCYVKLVKCDDLVKKYEEIANKKCFVPLVRCEESIQNLDKDQVQMEKNSSNGVLVDTHIAEESLLKSPFTTALSRSGSISILDDFTTFDVNLSHSVDNELQERSSSPVIDVFETIAAFQNLQQRCSIEATDQFISNTNIDILHVSCESEWYFTKNKMNMHAKTAILEDNTLCVNCVSEWNYTKHSLRLLLKDPGNEADRERNSTTESEDMLTTCTNTGSDDELIDTSSDPTPDIASIEPNNSRLINDKKDEVETNSADKEVTSELETATKLCPPEKSLVPKLMTLVSFFFQKHPEIVQQMKPNSKRKCTTIECNAVVRKVSRFKRRPATSTKPKIKAYETPVNNIEGQSTSIQVKITESIHIENTRNVKTNDEKDISEKTIDKYPNGDVAVSAQGISAKIQTSLITANVQNCEENKPISVLTNSRDFLEKCQSSNYVKPSDIEESCNDRSDKNSNSNEEIHSDVSALQGLRTNSDTRNNNVLCELEVSVEKLIEEKKIDKLTDNDKFKNTNFVDCESTLIQPDSEISISDCIAGLKSDCISSENTDTDNLSNADVEIREPINKGVGNLDHEYESSAIGISDHSEYMISDKESSQPKLNNVMDEGISKINNHPYNKKYNKVMCLENTEFDNEIEVLDCSSSSGDSKSIRSESSEQLDYKDDIQTLLDNVIVKSDENILRHGSEVEDNDNKSKGKEGPAKDSSSDTVTDVNTTDSVQNGASHTTQSNAEQARLHEVNLDVEDHAEESDEVKMIADKVLEGNMSIKAIENVPNSNDIKDVGQQECIISTIPKGFKPINDNFDIVNTDKKIEDCTPKTLISPVDKQVTLIYKDNSGLILKGIEYEDPEAGICYMFPLVHKNSESSDEANDSSDNILRVIQELGVVNKVNENVNTDDESDYELNVPKVTYADKKIDSPVSARDISYKRNLKRKIDMTDVKIVEKKYRKGKNIDFPKLTITAMKDTLYEKEYTRLINYCTSVDFTYSRPFHKEYIDVNQLLTDWPIKGEYDKHSNADCDIDKNLFIDEDHYERPEVIKDPLQLTLAEELEAEFKEPVISSSENNDSNFNMGFGEGSGRVKQNLKSVGGISNLSAATLSDVKQTQPLLLSRTNGACVSHNAPSARDDRLQALKRYTTYIAIRERVRTFFRNTSIELRNDLTDASDKANGKNSDTIGFPYGLNSTEFVVPSPTEYIVQVVQVGQLPVSAAAQNPVTCDPRVTQVSDPSPGQCSAENSPNDDPQSAIKTEYTELTTADLNLPLVQDYVNHNQNLNMEPQESNLPYSDENVSIQTEIKSEVKIELMEETVEEREPTECTEQNNQHYLQDKNDVNNIEYSFETNNTNMTSEINTNMQMMYNSTEKQSVPESYPQPKQQNGFPEKMDQIAHAMSAAGITTTCETIDNSRAQALVNMLSQKFRQSAVTTQSNNYPKTTSISALALQQALAQILPPPLNQTNLSENQQPTNNVGPQLLHFVQEKSASGNQITLVDNSQTSNGTPVLHIVQNKNNTGTANGTPSAQSNSFGGISLVDTGLQQGGNQLLQIVNTGNQKNNAAGQLLKRVNLLANLANVQGSNEQKMVQFVCKSADGKSIQLNAPHQRSMVLRLQPIESPNVQTAPKTIENQDPTANAANSTCQDNSQNEIKSRSVYEENYAKFIQNSSTKPTALEKSTSLPKFNQAFGKQGYQDGSQKQNEINNDTSHLSPVNSTENSECQPQDNNVNLDHIGSPPLLVRKPQTATTQQQQTNLVQQIKQSIAPMNLQTMHGGVIYTRQIPVNIGGGQTINLITVPSTDLLDDNAQKPPSGEIEPSIIKIVPQSQPTTNSDVSTSEDAHMGATNDNTHNHQPQPVLTQMRIKLPMLSKNPQVMAGARVVRPSFFQIQRNVIGGANQSVYQQLVLAAAPPLGQQTIRLPQTPTPRPVKVPTESQSSTESQMSSSTLEQLREFDLVLEQVKERSTVQPSSSSSTTFPKMHTPSTDTTDSASSVPPTSSSPTDTSQQSLYAAGTSHSQPLNVSYVTRKSTVTTPTTSTYVRSPDSSGIVDSPSSSTHEQIPHTVTAGESSTSSETPPQPKSSKSSKSKSRSKSSSNPPSTVKVSTVPPKTSTQKPLEDEQTTQRILYILAEYKEQVERSPDKDKPAPRRRNNPPTNPGSSKRKKCGSRRSGRDVSPFYGEDSCRTMGSEDSSCGTSQGDCNESCMDSHSPQDSPRKVARKLTFEQETPTPQPRPQPQRNVIVADGQTITVARGTAGKPATAVLMPANYILPVSMVKGGQQIAIMTNRGPKLLTVGGEGGTTNALLLQRLVGPAGLKPVLTRPGVRHVRLPTAALHNLQTFNFATTTTIQPPERVASPAPAPTPPDLIETRATSSPWADREAREPKPDRASSPEASEPWNLRTTTDPHEYSFGDTGRTENMNRTVLDPIPDRYSPDMEAQRIFDKMFDVESKKSFIIDSHEDSPRCGYDIDASDCDDKAYHQVVHKKEGSSHRQHRLTHVSAAALRHKYAVLEHELRLQKSLSEECEDLGVDSPSASELFPEAELLFAASPTHEHIQEQIVHTTPHPTILNSSVIQPDIDDQIATDHLLERDLDDRQDLSLGLEDVGIVTVSSDGTHTITLDHEEFARAHPNTTFHSEPTDETEVQPFTITGIGKGRQITSTIFHANRTPGTVLMAPQTTVISQATAEPSQQVKYADIDNMINSLPTAHTNNINLSSVLVKDDGLTRFDSILTDSREIHLSNTASAIIHSTGNATQVIRRVCYDDHKRERDTRYLMDEPEGLIAGDDAKMVAEDSSRDAIESMDGRSSPERHAELFWESNSASERSECRRPLDFSSDSDKCCKSPSYDEANSTDSSGIGTHMRLDSVIKEARGVERSGSADGSSADDGHPPLRTYPPKRLFNAPESLERSTSGKTRAGEHSPDPGPRRRASGRGVVKRGCHCCNGSPVPPKPKKSRQKKPTMDFTNNGV